jgi:UDP-glucuronate 4-epimerase
LKEFKTVLVTGGAGFIGSHTCEVLLKHGHDVISVDNFNDYYPPGYKRDNIECIQAADSAVDRFKSYEGDIRDVTFLNRVFDESHPDTVIHLAACAGVRPSILNPVLYTDVNIYGTVNILECLKKHHINKFLFASSSSVYGNNGKVPFCESDSVDRPISPYAATKKAGELLSYTYHHLYDINAACLRFFTVYGPRQRPDLAIYKFTELISEGQPIPFYGDGSTERDYTFIHDITDGIWRALQWTDSGEKRFEIFNLGESNTVTLSQMVKTIENELGMKAVLDYKPHQPGDVKTTYADISHAKAALGYNPVTEFEKGIKTFVDWYKQNRTHRQ